MKEQKNFLITTIDEKIYIFSAGRMGQEILRLINAINSLKKEWDVLGFVDKNIKIKKIES